VRGFTTPPESFALILAPMAQPVAVFVFDKHPDGNRRFMLAIGLRYDSKGILPPVRDLENAVAGIPDCPHFSSLLCGLLWLFPFESGAGGAEIAMG
jgi:hypothetical protein